MEFIDLSSGSYVLRVEARDMEQVANRIVLRKLIDIFGELVSVCTKPCMSYRRPSYSWHTQHVIHACIMYAIHECNTCMHVIQKTIILLAYTTCTVDLYRYSINFDFCQQQPTS